MTYRGCAQRSKFPKDSAVQFFFFGFTNVKNRTGVKIFTAAASPGTAFMSALTDTGPSGSRLAGVAACQLTCYSFPEHFKSNYISVHLEETTQAVWRDAVLALCCYLIFFFFFYIRLLEMGFPSSLRLQICCQCSAVHRYASVISLAGDW